jgi:hypothetical protein
MPNIDDKKGLVIETAATKMKTDPLYLSKLMREGGLPSTRIELIHKMQRSGLDFR